LERRAQSGEGEIHQAKSRAGEQARCNNIGRTSDLEGDSSDRDILKPTGFFGFSSFSALYNFECVNSFIFVICCR